MDTLREKIEHLMDHLVENDMDTLHEKKNHLVKFNFIRVYLLQLKKNKSKTTKCGRV